MPSTMNIKSPYNQARNPNPTANSPPTPAPTLEAPLEALALAIGEVAVAGGEETPLPDWEATPEPDATPDGAATPAAPEPEPEATEEVVTVAKLVDVEVTSPLAFELWADPDADPDADSDPGSTLVIFGRSVSTPAATKKGATVVRAGSADKSALATLAMAS